MARPKAPAPPQHVLTVANAHLPGWAIVGTLSTKRLPTRKLVLNCQGCEHPVDIFLSAAESRTLAVQLLQIAEILDAHKVDRPIPTKKKKKPAKKTKARR